MGELHPSSLALYRPHSRSVPRCVGTAWIAALPLQPAHSPSICSWLSVADVKAQTVQFSHHPAAGGCAALPPDILRMRASTVWSALLVLTAVPGSQGHPPQIPVLRAGSLRRVPGVKHTVHRPPRRGPSHLPLPHRLPLRGQIRAHHACRFRSEYVSRPLFDPNEQLLTLLTTRP